MLNQLIESRNNNEANTRKSGFLITTLGVLVAVLVSGWTYSLFAKNYGMGSGEMELSSLVAPVPVTEVAPQPKPEIKIEKSEKTSSDKITLKELYEDISAAKNPPKDLSGEKEVVNARQFDLSKVQRGETNQIPSNAGRTGDSQEPNCGLCAPSDDKNKKDDTTKEPEFVKPLPKSSPTPEVKKPTAPQSLGVINGRATYLAKPPYPAAAKQLRIADSVSVQVLIDENGNVVSASAVSGHPLLRAASVTAARQSKFSPTLLSGQPVKVTGIIVYKFTP